MSTPHIVIGGAGIIGLSAALEFAQQGFKVTVLEQGHAMREASWAAAGMLAAHDPENPAALRAFADLSLAAYPGFLQAIERLSGRHVPLRTTMTLQQTHRSKDSAPTSPELDLTQFAPGVSDAVRSFKKLDEQSLDPRDLCAALPSAAAAAGVTLLEHCSVLGIRRDHQSLRIRTSQGEHPADRYVHCCGAWSAVAELGGDLPIEPRKGQMLAVTMPDGAARLSCVIRTPELYLVPRGNGRIVIGATVERAGFDRTISAAATDALLAAAAELWPPLLAGAVTERWVGFRPGTPDGLPILGELAPGIFVAAGHYRNGILLAPGTAQLLRQLVQGEPPAIETSSFAPARFTAAMH